MVITSSSTAPLIAVVGATGNQGGSVLRNIALSRSPYRVRGLTRDATKPAGKALTDVGAEAYSVTLAADKPDVAAKAFEGTDIVFAYTTNSGNELAEGKSLVDAAKEAGVKLFVWSGLPNYTKISNGKYPNVNIFDEKTEVTNYARQVLGSSSVIDVQPPGFFTNFFRAHKPMKQADGTYKVSLPMRGDMPVCWIDMQRDFGAYVLAAIELGPEARPQEVRAASEVLSFDETTKILSEVTGKTITFQTIPPQVYEGILTKFMPAKAALALSEMWQTISDFGYYGEKKPTPLAELKSQYELRSFKRWAEETDWTETLA